MAKHKKYVFVSDKINERLNEEAERLQLSVSATISVCIASYFETRDQMLTLNDFLRKSNKEKSEVSN
jgi:hypothetical protein